MFMKTPKNEILEMVKGSIIVSCQALPVEPMYCEEMSLMPYFAKAAQQAGSKVIRTSSVRDVVAIKEKTGMPVIGLIKRNYEGFESYITPTMQEIDELVAADSDVIALDCTNMKRGDGRTITEFLGEIRAKYPDIAIMADISTFEEGVNAWKCGVDIVGTTMNGYTPYTEKTDGPNYELLAQLVEALPIPVIAEGRVHYPDQAKKMLELGAHAVVVGGAITRPLEIAQRFFKAIEE
jgi:N-acylglucosamine-6-phosphate 2-epimerase